MVELDITDFFGVGSSECYGCGGAGGHVPCFISWSSRSLSPSLLGLPSSSDGGLVTMGWRLEPGRFQYLYFASGQGSLDLWTLFIKIYIYTTVPAAGK